MIRVFWKNYPSAKPNAKLGGRYFYKGIFETSDIEEGKHIADLFRLKYEIDEEVEEKKVAKKTPSKKKVTK